MAAAKKPAIGLGPIGDDLAKLLKKALMQGGGKTKQAKRVLFKLDRKAGGILSNTPNARKIKDIRKAGARGLVQTDRARLKRSEMALTTKMANEHMSKQSLKGLNWDGSLNKASKAKVAAEKKAQAEVAARAKKAAIIKKADRQMSKAEVEAAKGTGRYVSPSSGKVTYVGPKRASVGRSKAGAIPAQMGKNFKNQAEVQAGLRDAFKKATTKEARLKAARALRKHQGDYGTFGK